MSIIQIRTKDRVFARMLEIVLVENNSEIFLTDKKDTKIPDGCELIITDTACADKETDRFDKIIYVCRGEEPPQGSISVKRPFLIEDFISLVNGMLFAEEKTADSQPFLTLDKKRKTLRYGKFSVLLTDKEFDLMLLLYENKGKIVTNEQITKTVWDDKTVPGSNISAVYINYLRKKFDEKLGKKFIYSVRGKGYQLKI